MAIYIGRRELIAALGSATAWPCLEVLATLLAIANEAIE
jgi:hypothetical protein